MSRAITRRVRAGINIIIGMSGFELVRKTHNWEDFGQFIPFKETMADAKRAGLSVGDFIDTTHNVPGTTQATLDRLRALGVFNGRIERVCEIGPGSGRYLEKTLLACKPSHYEIYETAPQWRDWLVRTYPVVSRPTDGRTLKHTPSASVDLVQAHKVFVGTPFLITYGYLQEMTRVTRPGGWVVFDIVSEECMDNATRDIWLKSGVITRTYPMLTPRDMVVSYLQSRACVLVGSFLVPMKPGTTQCMAFRKQTVQTPNT